MPWGLGNVAVLLLPLALLGYGALAMQSGKRLGIAALQGLVLWGWTLWALSESLGAWGQLKPLTLGLDWALVVLAQALLLARRPLQRPALPTGRPNKRELLLLLGLGGLALYTLKLALFNPTWNNDVQFYHLPRVQQWAQQASLAHFPTSYDLQVFYPPWAETALLNLRLLSGDDLLGGLLQWGSWLACALAAWEAAALAGGGRSARLASAAAMATLPMGVLQSVTNQNDLVASAWIMAMACLLLAELPLWAAGAAGLALATKGTAYLYVAPLGLWLIASRLKADGFGAWRILALAALLAFAPSLPHWTRNYRAAGTWLGSAQDHRLPHPGLRPLASNLLKGAGLQLETPYFRGNLAAVDAVSAAHAALGLPLDEPDWIWAGIPWGHYLNPDRGWHEDFAGDPLHLFALLALGALAIAGIWSSPLPWGYSFSACAGLLLYSGLVRYNPWATRLHLPFFALCAPLLGLAWARLSRPWLAVALGLAFLSMSWWAALDDHGWTRRASKPGFSAKYWTGHPSYLAGYNAAKLGKRIGLLIPERTLEYGLWRGAREADPTAKLQHLSPSARTAGLSLLPPYSAFIADVVIADVQKAAPPTVEAQGRRWYLAARNDFWGIYTGTPLRGAPSGPR